jgi:hypothetical protein
VLVCLGMEVKVWFGGRVVEYLVTNLSERSEDARRTGNLFDIWVHIAFGLVIVYSGH